ncbi:MAG: universal stress protein [Syntrophobacteraceae bacterium]|jgi:nucleotide-binding universal stress UspA family protein
MEIKKILWPTDLSKTAAEAQQYVSFLSQVLQAEIHLIYVAEDLSRFEHYWGTGPDPKHTRELQEHEMAAAKKRLEDLCREHLSGCPMYHIHILMGEPAQEILKAIETIGVGLVIMATRGLKDIFPFGSVAERVIKNSPVPVLTVNPKTRRPV